MTSETRSRPGCRGFGFVLAAALAAACAPVSPANATDGSWRHDPVWDDGKAEFCAYEVDWRRYGNLFPGRALMILVKEPWAPDLEVKADVSRPDGFEVLKLNHVRDVATGIYTYHQMASVFFRRDNGALRKLATTSSEGCGISTTRMTGGRLETRSYFDGQGSHSVAWPADGLAEDGLPALLRDWVAAEPPPAIRVVPSLMAGYLPEPVAEEWRVVKRSIEDVGLPAGSFSGVEIRLERADDWATYLFATEPPHELLRLTASDGTDYRLAKCERIRYWRMNGPGGEAWLPEAVR